MKKLILLSILVLFMSCVQNPTNNVSELTEIDSIGVYDNANSVQKVDSFAIGNIKMGCSKKEFEIQKKKFIKDNKKLGNLMIERIDPFFVDNQLAEVTIYSERYVYGKMLADWISQNPKVPKPKRWKDLYDEKYSKSEDNLYKKGFMTIEVSDEGGDAVYDISIHHKIINHNDNKTRSFIRITDPRLMQIQIQRVKKEREKEQQKASDLI